MKTEISRDSHQLEKRYSGVYQQQGRMLTDADWNELVEIIKGRLNDALKDVVGSKEGGIGGAPRHRALKIVEDGADAFKIQPGHVYADGVAAQVPGDADIAYGAQPDFPSPPDLPDNYVLYADVWERTVTHLMDERLRDEGLHGADTCTRKQMMAQVKWCPYDTGNPANPDNDPEQSAKNPAKGDAELTITLLQKSTESDPCDPCAAQLDVESKIGNYLFRVEVHDVKGDANGPTKITLKWSSENGAEQFEALATKEKMPAGFFSDKWVYEFFDKTSEKHLGVHLVETPWEPARDMLKEIKEPSSPYSVPTIPGSSETKKFVRRWDGYCTLDLSSKTLTEGIDRGVALSTTKAAEALGFVKIDSSLQIILASIRLDMTLDGKKFVAGDYWLADVREAAHEPNAVLIEDETPHGIDHHYLTLGTVEDGALQDNPEADRKYAYPPLTEMTRIFLAGGDGQEVMPGEPLPQPIRVGVANGEWPVEGATVRFQIEAGGGSSSPINGGKTNADGIAECTWTPGNAMDEDFRVKATLVDPDHANDASMDMDPPVYFYANLITADQVAYDPVCEPIADNTVHKLLVEDTLTPPDQLILGADGYYTVKEVLDALLCRLKAKHIPYNPNESSATTSRWKDIKELSETGELTEPNTVQQAIDDLIKWLESTDIRYLVKDCGDAENPSVRSKLGLAAVEHKIDRILDELLCNFKATHLPIDKNEVLCDTLNQADIKTVQDALNALCKMDRGCAVTVGEGGKYASLELAFEELKNETQISICLLPGKQHIIENIEVSDKQSISITGNGTIVFVQGQLSLEATNVTLSGIHFSVIDKESEDGKGTGSITLSSPSGGNVVVEHCIFYRIFSGEAATWHPLVTVGKLTNLTWVENRMQARRQDEEIRSAVILNRDEIPEVALAAYDGLVAVWLMNPYEDLDAYHAKVTAAAEMISGLTSATREEWYAKRPVTLINKLRIESVRVSLPGFERERLEPIPGRGGPEPIPGRITPRSLPGLTATLDRRSEVSELSPKGEVTKFFEFLNLAEEIDVVAFADVIHTVVALVNTFDYALALESNDVWGWITNNDISGYVALNYGQKARARLAWTSTASDTRQGNKDAWAKNRLASDLSAKNQLSLRGNDFAAVHSMIHQITLNNIHKILDSGFNSEETPPITIPAYKSMTVRDNTFYEESSSFISQFLNVSGNQFPNSAGGNVVAYTLGFSGVFLGGQALVPTAVIEQILRRKRQAANFLKIV